MRLLKNNTSKENQTILKNTLYLTSRYEKRFTLMITHGRSSSHAEVDMAHFHNFYEHLVIDEILFSDKEAAGDEDYRSDVACVALNHLPPRYVRHDVDMSFFLSPQEYSEIEEKISKSVQNAIKIVRKNRAFHDDGNTSN